MQKCVSVLLAAVIAISAFVLPCSAQTGEELIPFCFSNAGDQKMRPTSFLTPTENGYMRLNAVDSKLYMEYYNDSFELQSQKIVDFELPLFGGFYSNGENYYVVEGQTNQDEKPYNEVIRIIKYDTEWNRLGAASIPGVSDGWGGEVRYPFDLGSGSMTEIDGILYYITGHEGFVDESVGQGHQGMYLVAVDETTMEGSFILGDYWHSFDQFIRQRDGDLYLYEYSEGSRATTLKKLKIEDDSVEIESGFPVFEYGGSRTSAWAVATYADAKAMELSSKNVIGIGTSIDQSKYDKVRDEVVPYNIYLTVTPFDDFTQEATKVIWLTEYTEEMQDFMGAGLTKISDDRFMVFWQLAGDNSNNGDETVTNKLHYVFIDGDGNKVSQEYTASAPISDCRPIVKGSKVSYFASSLDSLDFYTIDADTGEITQKTYTKMINPFCDGLFWTYEDDVLTISGEGKYTEYEGSWGRWENYLIHRISSNIYTTLSPRKLVIKGTVKEIPPNEFTGFGNIEEIILEEGVEVIGDRALNCPQMRWPSTVYITIPKSVKTIGENAFCNPKDSPDEWGFATIRGYRGTIAEQYAKDHDLNFVPLDEESSDTELTTDTDAATDTDKPIDPGAATDTDKPIDPGAATDTDKTIDPGTATDTDKPIDPGAATDTDKTTDPGAATDTDKTTDPGTATDTDKTTDTDPQELLMGDVDRDGYITSNDALMILRESIGMESFDTYQTLVGDINEDGVIDSADALGVLRLAIM